MRLGILFLFLFLSCHEAFAQSVYFVTDRKFETKKGGIIDFQKQNTDDLSLLNYGFQKEEVRGNSKKKKKRKKAKFYPELVDSWIDFKEKFREKIKESGSDHFILFVHGCCVDFKEAAKQANMLSETSGKPVLIYDWGTPKGNYFGSMLACPRAQERFNNFIYDLFQEYPTTRISVVGLSMGNVLVYNFCLQNKVSDLPRHFNEIEMARADIDTIVFKTSMHKVIPHCDKLDLYVAKNDFLINISGFMRGLIYPYPPVFMLGHPHGNLDLGTTVEVFDVTRLKLGHLLPCEAIATVLNGPQTYNSSEKYSFSDTGHGVKVITRIKKK